MRCSRVQQLYEEYSRGDLPLGSLSRIEEHLAGCPECRDEFELNDQIAQAVRDSHEVVHPGDFYFENLNRRVLSNLSDPEKANVPIAPLPPRFMIASRPMWWTGAGAAAALLALGFFGQPTAQNTHTLKIASPPEGDRPGAEYVVASAQPTIVTTVDNKRRELIISPSLQEHLDLSLASADGADVTPSRTGRANSGGQGDSSSAQKSAMSSASGSSRSGLSNTLDLPTGAPGEATIQQVSLAPSRPELGENGLPREINTQLERIQRSMPEPGDDLFIEQLRELDNSVQGYAWNDPSIEGRPVLRQVRLYLRAEDSLAAGHAMEAATDYHRILTIDKHSRLALRAAMQLADLSYYEWADFQEARKWYNAAFHAPEAESAFNEAELEHIKRRLDRLESFEANGWEALRLLHSIQRPNNGWAEVNVALRQLNRLRDSGELLPEAARAIVNQVQVEPGPPLDVAVEIYQLLQSRAEAEENSSVRAWLELTLGDLQLLQFQEQQTAIVHYNKAIAASGDSGASQLARTKRDQLIDRQFLDIVQ